ncbi:hypothetical protein HM1_0783 [Heliomicrobium modesticaldum Ice1]|uniref:Uncharacterized protein n=1 Tax=Heliobacterium modesticaldum (strain ATCC 51547 / Ice1) TaxID=498761 RepID=B0TB45_HELMI|nr:hypothetical protein HM1_0783 [Heliomicrobium modesticaldum Ice1]
MAVRNAVPLGRFPTQVMTDVNKAAAAVVLRHADRLLIW